MLEEVAAPPQWIPLTGTEGGLEENTRRQHSCLSRLPASVALNHQQTAMFAILGGRSEGGSLLDAALSERVELRENRRAQQGVQFQVV